MWIGTKEDRPKNIITFVIIILWAHGITGQFRTHVKITRLLLNVFEKIIVGLILYLENDLMRCNFTDCLSSTYLVNFFNCYRFPKTWQKCLITYNALVGWILFICKHFFIPNFTIFSKMENNNNTFIISIWIIHRIQKAIVHLYN